MSVRAYAMCAAAWFPSMHVVSPPLRICEVKVVSASMVSCMPMIRGSECIWMGAS